MYYPEELVEEVRARNDIVDVISGYVTLKKREATIGAVVLFITRKHLLFRCLPISRCITASDAMPAEMYIHFL